MHQTLSTTGPPKLYFSVSSLLSARNVRRQLAYLCAQSPMFEQQSSRIPWDRRDCSVFFANNCSQVAVDSYKDSSRRVLAILTFFASSPVILAASGANRQPCLASWMNCPSPFLLSSFCDRLRAIHQRFLCTSSLCSTQIQSVMYTLSYSILCASHFCFFPFLVASLIKLNTRRPLTQLL